MNLKHTELIEYRQRIATLQRKRGEATDEEWKLRRWLDGKAKEYNVLGLRHQINPDTGEIEVYPEKCFYPGKCESANNSEKIAEGRNIWTEEEPNVNLQDHPNTPDDLRQGDSHRAGGGCDAGA